MGATTQSRVFNVLAAGLTPRGRSGCDLILRTDGGALTLRFPPTLAAQLLWPADAAAAPRKIGSGAPIKAALRTGYLIAYCDWQTTPGLTQTKACERHGVPYYGFTSWIAYHRAECEAALAAHRATAPVRKPSGALL